MPSRPVTEVATMRGVRMAGAALEAELKTLRTRSRHIYSSPHYE
jgi:hypothetical protein